MSYTNPQINKAIILMDTLNFQLHDKSSPLELSFCPRVPMVNMKEQVSYFRKKLN